MGCRPSRSTLSKVSDSTCEYNRCYMKEFDVARRKQKKSYRNSKRRMPTYNNFSSTTKVYDRSSGTSKITVRLSTDGSMLEIEQFDIEYDSTETPPEVAENIDEEHGLVMKSNSELKTQRIRDDYKRCNSAPQLSNSSGPNCRRTEEPSCGLVGCCIQNWTDSGTISEEYKPKTVSTVECQNRDEVVVEHSCEVHRDCETTKKISDDKCSDSDTLNDPSSRSRHQAPAQNDKDENTRVKSTKSESVGQKTTILVKRSSLEQQTRSFRENGMESHLHYTCSTFKPLVEHGDKNGRSGSQVMCNRNHDNHCNTCTLCQKDRSSVEISGEVPRSSGHTNSITLGVNDKKMNKTNANLINNNDRRPENLIAENNQLSKICSSCNNSKYNSEICDYCCINSECGCCQNASCQNSGTITNDTSNKRSRSKFSSPCYGTLNLDLTACCCCCFAKYNNNGESSQQYLLFSHYRDAYQAADTGNNDNDNRLTPTGDRNNKNEELLHDERQSLIDHHKDIAYNKETPYSFNCIHRSNDYFLNVADSALTSLNSNLEDGKVFQKSCCDNHLDVSTHSESNSKHNASNTDFGIRCDRELVSQRPCVPNKTATQDLDIYNHTQRLQKSITVTEGRRKHECQEHFKISKGIMCVHDVVETTNVGNLKPASMVTSEVARNSCEADNRTCINLQHTERPCGDDDVSDIVDNHVYQNSCCCHKGSFVVASEEYRFTDFYDDIEERSISDNDIPDHIDQKKQGLETFRFCEYESFVVKDNDTLENGEDETECNKLLIEENVEESFSTDNSNNTDDDDDDDFDGDSSDECRDEYVDALETTYV